MNDIDRIMLFALNKRLQSVTVFNNNGANISFLLVCMRMMAFETFEVNMYIFIEY